MATVRNFINHVNIFAVFEVQQCSFFSSYSPFSSRQKKILKKELTALALNRKRLLWLCGIARERQKMCSVPMMQWSLGRAYLWLYLIYAKPIILQFALLLSIYSRWVVYLIYRCIQTFSSCWSILTLNRGCPENSSLSQNKAHTSSYRLRWSCTWHFL